MSRVLEIILKKITSRVLENINKKTLESLRVLVNILKKILVQSP